MFGDLDWPINASRRFVSDSWVSCSIISSCCLRVYLLDWCDFCLYKVVGLSNTWQFLNSHCLLRKSQKTPKARLHLVNQNKSQAETQISINQSISLFQEQTHKNWDRRKDSGNIQRLLKIQWTDKNVLQINTHNNVQSVSQSIDQDWKRKDIYGWSAERTAVDVLLVWSCDAGWWTGVRAINVSSTQLSAGVSTDQARSLLSSLYRLQESLWRHCPRWTLLLPSAGARRRTPRPQR